MKRRKNIFTTTTTDKAEFLQALSDAIGNYAPRCHDIEASCHEILGVQIYTITVYKF